MDCGYLQLWRCPDLAIDALTLLTFSASGSATTIDMEMPNRTITTIFLLTMSSMACVYLIAVFELTNSSVIGLGLGIIAGIVTCGYVQLSNVRLMGNYATAQTRTSRWLIPTTVASVVLARIVIGSIVPKLQYAINGFFFAWIMIFFSYAAIWIWRHSRENS